MSEGHFYRARSSILAGVALSILTAQSALAADAFKPALGLVIQTGASSNLYPLGSEQHEATLDLSLSPVYRFAPQWSVGAILAGSRQLTDLQEFSLDRSDISLQWKGRALNPLLSVSASGSLILPFAGERLVRESLILGSRVGGRLTFQSREAGWDRFTLSYAPSFAKFFHDYQTSVGGTPNSSFSISQSVGLSAQVSSRLSVSGVLSLSDGWTYGGTQTDRFSVDGELNFDISTRTSLGLGVSTSGSQLKANGVDPNLAIFDSNRSQVWASFGVSL